MQVEEVYTSLQWDSSPPNHYEKPLFSNKCAGMWRVMVMVSCILCLGSLAASFYLGIKLFQISTIAAKQQENLIQQERELLNFTQWKRKQDRLMKCCQTLMGNSVSSAHNCSPCPDNWIQNGERCYYFSRQWQVWRRSKELCFKEDAKLLQIDNKEEMDFITSILKNKNGDQYWVGLSQEKRSGLWFWQDGSSPPPALWSIQKLQSVNQGCGYLKDKALFNADCSNWKYFIFTVIMTGICKSLQKRYSSDKYFKMNK
ncbi:C-type lectin domain family 9 member A [Echinops telfairi]|uniref:C-type lectin domain family 9 member A n=1 Tax=Echinops telfairi TaxID=9371 RepID=A0ABM1VKR3_ECHTE|nr:C-type lectin domain family 9 member A [Echinops telfairi]